MTGRRTSTVLLLTALAAGIIAFLPARIFESAANRALGPTARLQTSGTVWRGRGELQFTRGAGALAIPLAWQFEPSWLARFRLGWRLHSTAPAATGSTSVGIGLNSLALRDTEFSTDASLWHRLSPAAMLLGAGGRLTLHITDGDVVVLHRGDQPRVEGNARIEAGNFALTTLAPQALGNYHLKLNAQDGAVHFSFLPAQGVLQFDGAGMLTLASPRSFAFKGTASLSADLAPSMAASIRSAGTPQADGRVLIDMKRNW